MSHSRLLHPITPLNSVESTPSSGHKELFDYAIKGKYMLFKSQINAMMKNMHLNYIFQPRDVKGSPLILAAQKGHNKIVSYILKNFLEVLDLEYSMTIRSDFTGHEVKGATALWCASLGGHVNIVKDLVEAGANINHSNATNSTPLRAASYHNREEVIVYLLNQGADINIANQVGQAPVMISVLRENEMALRLLVTHGRADLSQTTSAGIDSLHITIERESKNIFHLLLSLGAKIIWPTLRPSPSPLAPYYIVPEVYQPPCHIFVAAKCHNLFAMDYFSKHQDCTRECEVDMWLVRGIERRWDYPTAKVIEVWRRALELRENYSLEYPGKPAVDLYEGVQEVMTLSDIYNISPKKYLIQCVLISERIFGPLYCVSCDLKIKLTDNLYRENSAHHWRCCELLYQLLQAVVKRSWMPTHTSVNEFISLLAHVNSLIPAFNTDVMTMERFAAFLKCIYTRYAILLSGMNNNNMNISFDKCLNHVLSFINIWLKKFPDMTDVGSVVYMKPTLLKTLQVLFNPLPREEPIYHCIMSSKHFSKYENVLNAFVSISTPDMLEVSNKDGLTALHFACKLETVSNSVIHTLIQAGAHIDAVTPLNQTPIECCTNKLSTQYQTLRLYYPVKLACLSARAIVQYQLPTDSFPAFFHTFIDTHRIPPPKLNE